MPMAIPDVQLQPGTLRFLESEPKRLLINGEWVEAASGETFETVNPADGQCAGACGRGG